MMKRCRPVPIMMATALALAANASDDIDWPLKAGNADSQHYSALDEINDRTVSALGLAWATDIPSPDGIAATPIVVDGVAIRKRRDQGRNDAADEHVLGGKRVGHDFRRSSKRLCS